MCDTLVMFDGSPRELRIYRMADGREPFKLWLESLRDRQARARIRTRLDRLEAGNPGQYRVLGGGVCELKIDYAAGYRVYFGESGGAVVLLLCGGTKPTQDADIAAAQEFWADYRRRENG